MRAAEPKLGNRSKQKLAEGVGFEPTDPFGSPVFKTGAIDHSATPPDDSPLISAGFNGEQPC
jgi:hypothetical protein